MLIDTDQSSPFENRKSKFEKLGFAVSLFFCIAIIGSSATIQISGAVLTAGNIIQTGENKSVQHPDGGPVARILIENGSVVNEGDTLIILDDANITAQKKLLSKRKLELRLSLDRLRALEKHQDIDFYSSNYQYVQTTYPEIVARQTSLFSAQKERFLKTQQQLQTRIMGLSEELTALKKQIKTSKQQLNFLDQSITDISELYAERLVSKSRLTTLQREKIAVLTEIDALNLSKARAANALHDAKHQLSVTKKENQEALWLEIDTTTNEYSETLQSLAATNDAFSRLVVTAPASGRIHELAVKNIDAVVSPGQVIMQIVPASAKPVVNARVAPLDIEQVYVKQEARIRFDSFDANTTPEIKGIVTRVSPDTSTDETTGEIYYSVIVTLPETEIEKINQPQIIAGLPVSVMLTTNSRSILSYLTKPITSKMFEAFRDG